MCSPWTPTARARSQMKIATAATELGVPVLRPVVEHGRYDLGLEIGDHILRVQCKWGALDETQALVKVSLRTSWLTPAGYVRSPYLPSEIDLVAVYCGALDRCYLLPRSLACERTAIHLGLTPPRNKQRACINLASEFDFAGAVAQLEERRAGSAKARGSSPLSSTHSSTEVGCHQFRNHFASTSSAPPRARPSRSAAEDGRMPGSCPFR
jgi:hypothetical protein